METQHARVLAASVLFLSLFRAFLLWLGSGPVLLLLRFCLRGETQIWMGDLRVVLGVFCVVRSWIALPLCVTVQPEPSVFNLLFDSLYNLQDRALSQAVFHSATTALVVWLLALDFIFTRCVSPCPRNFDIGCCANEKPLRLIAHRRVRFFTFMFVSTLVLWARGELIESNSSFGKYCDSGD